MRRSNYNIGSTGFHKRIRCFADRPASVDHVVDHDAKFAGDITDDAVGDRLVRRNYALSCRARCTRLDRQVSLTDKSFQYGLTCQTGERKLTDRRMDRLLK